MRQTQRWLPGSSHHIRRYHSSTRLCDRSFSSYWSKRSLNDPFDSVHPEQAPLLPGATSR